MADVKASLIILVFISLRCSTCDAQYPLVISVAGDQSATRLYFRVNDAQIQKLKIKTCQTPSFFFISNSNDGVTIDPQCQPGSKQGNSNDGNFQTMFSCLYEPEYDDIGCTKKDLNFSLPDCTPQLSVRCDMGHMLVIFDSQQDSIIQHLEDDGITVLESCCLDPLLQDSTTLPNIVSPATTSSLSSSIPDQQQRTSNDEPQNKITTFHIAIIVGTAVASILITILVVCCVLKLRNIRRDKRARDSATGNGREENIIGSRFVSTSMSSLQNAGVDSQTLPNQKAVAQVSPIQASSGFSSSGGHYFDVDIRNSDFVDSITHTNREVEDASSTVTDTFDDDDYIYPNDIANSTDSKTYAKLGQSRKESDNDYSILPEDDNEASTSQRQGEDQSSSRRTPNYILQTSTGHYIEIDLPVSPSTANLLKTNYFSKDDSCNSKDFLLENNSTRSEVGNDDGETYSQLGESNRVIDNPCTASLHKDINTQVPISHKINLPEVIPLPTSRRVVGATEIANNNNNNRLRAIPSSSSIASTSQKSNESVATNVSDSTGDAQHIHPESFDTRDQSSNSKSKLSDTPLEAVYDILSTKKDKLINDSLPVAESREQPQSTNRSATPLSNAGNNKSIDEYYKTPPTRHTPNGEDQTDSPGTPKMIQTKTPEDKSQNDGSVTPKMETSVSILSKEITVQFKPIKAPRKTVGTSPVPFDTIVQTKKDSPDKINASDYKNVSKRDSMEHKDNISTTPCDMEPALNDVEVIPEGCKALDIADNKDENASVYDHVVGPPRKVSTMSSASVDQIQVVNEKPEVKSVKNDYENISNA